jgi:hypothetical protein
MCETINEHCVKCRSKTTELIKLRESECTCEMCHNCWRELSRDGKTEYCPICNVYIASDLVMYLLFESD